MKKLTALFFVLFAVFNVSHEAHATQLINDTLDFGYYGIINDTDDNLDAVTSYSGSYVNLIEWSTNTADTLQWYQSFSAPASFDIANVVSVKFYLYLRDDNDDDAAEYAWFWSEDSAWIYIDNEDIDTGYYDFNVSIGALDGFGVYAAVTNTSNFAYYQSDFYIDRSILHIEYIPTPEPSTLITLGFGVCGLLGCRLFKRKNF